MFLSLFLARYLQVSDQITVYGDYRVVHSSNDFERGDDGEPEIRQSIQVLDRDGRTVTSISGCEVVASHGVRVSGRDTLILCSTSGGVHASSRFWIWSLGASPRCLIDYDQNNFAGDWRLERNFDRVGFELADGIIDPTLVDLDGDEVPEIVTYCDVFGYRGVSAYGGAFPVVLKLVGDRYQDVSSRFPAIYARLLSKKEVELRSLSRGAAERSPWEIIESIYAIRTILHGRQAAFREVEELLPMSYRAGLVRNRKFFETMIDSRLLKLSPTVGYRPVDRPKFAPPTLELAP